MNNPNTIILSLDLGTKTGWALSNKHGRIMSGTAHFRPRRFEGGGMRYLRFERMVDVAGYAAILNEINNKEGVSHG